MPTPNAVIKITSEEGGEWTLISIHSFQMPGGAEWDVLNGWRSDTPPPLEEHGEDDKKVTLLSGWTVKKLEYFLREVQQDADLSDEEMREFLEEFIRRRLQ